VFNFEASAGLAAGAVTRILNFRARPGSRSYLARVTWYQSVTKSVGEDDE